MDITVTQAAPESVSVTSSDSIVISTGLNVEQTSVVAATVQPTLAGMVLERVGEDGWTIWIEDSI